MAGTYEVMRFLEIVLAGLRVATLTPRIYPSPFADRPSVIAPARAGGKRKFMKVIQSSLDQAQVPLARSRDMIMNFFRMLKDRQKDVGIIGAPADGTLAAHCRPNGKFGTSV